jgi:hypothetical protein
MSANIQAQHKPKTRVGGELVRAIYHPMSFEVAPVEVIGQVIEVDGWRHLWVDGLDERAPVTVPLEVLRSYEPFGTFGSYLDENLERVEEILAVCPPEASPTMLVRACELLKSGTDATSAVTMAYEWSRTLMDLDILEARLAMALLSDEPLAASVPAPRG